MGALSAPVMTCRRPTRISLVITNILDSAYRSDIGELALGFGGDGSQLPRQDLAAHVRVLKSASISLAVRNLVRVPEKSKSYLELNS